MISTHSLKQGPFGEVHSAGVYNGVQTREHSFDND